MRSVYLAGSTDVFRIFRKVLSGRQDACTAQCRTGRAAVVLQQGINQLTPGAIPSLAFNVGPLTRRHSTALAEAGRQLELVEATLDQRAAWYRRLAAAKPSSAVFLKGWLRRTEDCRRLVRELATEWSLA